MRYTTITSKILLPLFTTHFYASILWIFSTSWSRAINMNKCHGTIFDLYAIEWRMLKFCIQNSMPIKIVSFMSSVCMNSLCSCFFLHKFTIRPKYHGIFRIWYVLFSSSAIFFSSTKKRHKNHRQKAESNSIDNSEKWLISWLKWWIALLKCAFVCIVMVVRIVSWQNKRNK